MITFIESVPLSETDISNYCKTGRSEGEKRQMGCFQKNRKNKITFNLGCCKENEHIHLEFLYFMISNFYSTYNTKCKKNTNICPLKILRESCQLHLLNDIREPKFSLMSNPLSLNNNFFKGKNKHLYNHY